MKLPSNRYFELIQTEDDYAKFIGSGMAFEVEPLAPISWQEHKQMVEYKKRKEKNMNEVVIKVVTAVWCQNCSVLKKLLDNSGIQYRVVDADDFNNQEYLKQLNIRGLPTTFFEIDGEVVGEPKRGLISVAEIRKAIDDLVSEMEGK